MCALLALAISCAGPMLQPAFAQYENGTIVGDVRDPSGAAVPNATVTVKNNATGAARTFTSDPEGKYQFNAVPAGIYTITAAAPAFKTETISNLEVRVNTQIRVDINMQVGAVSESVQVSAGAPLLQTDTASLGTTIDNRTVLELPLNARNFFDLVALTPGTLKTLGGSSVMDSRSVEVGGIRNTSTNAMLDGVDFTIGNVFNPAIALSLDALGEFKVQVNFMDATYGHGAAGIDLVTKSGSNQFHGVGYDFIRNRALQAGQFFRPAAGAPRFSFNQFGGSVGGPIKKDKIFFFGNYEGRRRSTGNVYQGLVPTQAELAGDFSALNKTIRDPFNNNAPFAGNIIPQSRWDPIAKQLIQYFPQANIARPGANFLATPSDHEQRDQWTGRGDWRQSEKASMFGRYTLAVDSLGNAAYRTGLGLIRPDRSQFAVIGYTYLISPNLISESRAGWTKAFLARQSDGDRSSTNYASQLGLKNLAAGPGDYALPNISLSGYTTGGNSNAPNFVGYGSHIVQNNIYYRLGQTFTWIRGKHTLKMGGDWNRLMVGYDQGSSQDGIFGFGGTFTGDSFADFLLGIPSSATGGLGSLGDYGGVAKYAIGTQWNAFFQDDWKVTDRLTLNLGVRYEVFIPWRGRLANFDLASGRQLLAGSPDYFVPGVGLIKGTGAALLPQRPIQLDGNDFAPRVGIAYRLGEKTTIRTGGGIFYLLNTGGTVINPMMSTAPFFVIANLTSSSVTPQLFLSNLFPAAAQTPASVSTDVDLKKRDGYVYEYNFNIQHELARGLLLEAGYIGNTAQKQVGSVWVNQPMLPANPLSPTPFTAREPYPNLPPTFQQVTNYQWGNYNAGYVKLEQRFTSGISYILSYTHSKFLDVGAGNETQNMYNRRLDRGLADTDVPDNFIGNYVWDLPFGHGRKFDIRNPILNGVLGGWEFSGITNMRTGMPLTITTTGDIANVGTGNQRGSSTGIKPSKIDPRTNNLLGFNTAAYTVPPKGQFGNLSRNTQRGFGINDWDMGINKNFAIHQLGEGSRLQIRAEFFNIFNHTQFSGIGTVVNTPTFGIVNSTLDPRILQLAGKFYF